MGLVKTKEQEQALEMFQAGVSQIEIARELNVTEKTVGAWAKVFKEDLKTRKLIETKIANRLNKLLDAQSGSTEDIKNLAIAYAEVSNISVAGFSIRKKINR